MNPEQDKSTLILDAALKCFENFGYKSTTVEQITKVANMGKGTFYNFFSSKEEVFQTIIQQQIHLITVYSNAVISSDKPGFEALNHYLESALKCQNQQKLFDQLRMEAEISGTKVVLEGLKQIDDVALISLKNILDAYVVKGLILPCDTTLIAFLMIELYESLSKKWALSNAPFTTEQIQSIYATLFQAYLPT